MKERKERYEVLVIMNNGYMFEDFFDDYESAVARQERAIARGYKARIIEIVSYEYSR